MNCIYVGLFWNLSISYMSVVFIDKTIFCLLLFFFFLAQNCI